jgi:ribosomal protein S18 acetylase RimI-like enzyme
MTQPQVAIRKMQRRDVAAVVQVHRAGFSGFFLTFLGPAFLRELYTATFIDHAGISFVAEGDKDLIGFVVGTAQPAGFYRRLLRQRWPRFAWAAILPALKRPSAIPRLLRAFSMPRQVTQQQHRGTLMSIAVLPDAQGHGVGRALVYAFLAEAGQRGLHHVDLTTDHDENEAANTFYQKLGFVCSRTFTTPEGRTMNEYVITLQKEQNNA